MSVNNAIAAAAAARRAAKAPEPTIAVPAKDLSPAEQALADARGREASALLELTATTKALDSANKAMREIQAKQLIAFEVQRSAENKLAHACSDTHDAERMLVVEKAAKDQVPIARFRVVKAGYFSMSGSIATVHVGQVVTLQAYGIDGLDRMRARGIVLEPIQ